MLLPAKAVAVAALAHHGPSGAGTYTVQCASACSVLLSPRVEVLIAAVKHLLPREQGRRCGAALAVKSCGASAATLAARACAAAGLVE